MVEYFVVNMKSMVEKKSKKAKRACSFIRDFRVGHLTMFTFGPAQSFNFKKRIVYEKKYFEKTNRGLIDSVLKFRFLTLGFSESTFF